MSKKRFSEGLDELLQPTDSNTTTVAQLQAQGALRERRSNASKNFVRDLEALFEEAMIDLEDAPESDSNTPPMGVAPSSAPARSAGIDALIRPTQTPSTEATEPAAALKRLTVTIERAKLEKLRSLARVENLYLKDLLQRAIDDYLKKYEPSADAAP